MSPGVVSTQSLAASAAEVYAVYSEFSNGQLELMQRLLVRRDTHSTAVQAASVGVTADVFDLRKAMESAISRIAGGMVTRDEAEVLLQYFRLYQELFYSSSTPACEKTLLPHELPPKPLPAQEINGASVMDVVPVEEEQIDITLHHEGLSISGFEEKYMRVLEPTHKKPYVRDTKSAFKWLIEKVGDPDITGLNASILEPVFASEFGRASHNAARFYRTLKAAFGKAEKWGYVSTNPFTSFKLPKIPEKAAAYFKESDVQKVLEQKISRDYKELFAFAFYTGMRLKEIVTIKWESVDLENKVLTVSNQEDFTTKSKKERIIPLAGVLYDVLVERHAGTHKTKTPTYVFERRGKHYNDNYASRLLKKSVRSAGLGERLHFHSLRHGFGSNLLRANANPVHVQKLMGHANLSTTMKYIHIEKDDLEKAIGKLDTLHSKTT